MKTERFPEGTPLRVAFTGPAGAGKTTHAKLMQQKHHGDVVSFATPLKKVCRDVFGERMDDPEFYRTTLQATGVFFRNIDRDIWVKLLTAKVSPDRPCFVDDCRFYNEYQALNRLGFVFVRLGASMDTLNERRPGMTNAQRLHASELESAMIPGDIVEWTEDEVEDVHIRIALQIQQLRPTFAAKIAFDKPAKVAAK